jgi:hypothetical protein
LRLFHENETTLKVENAVHKKFCRKKIGETHSFMHRDGDHAGPFDQERESDSKGKPVLK